MICIPIMADNRARALRMIARSAGLADVLEFRMDLIAGGDVGELIIAARCSCPSVKILVTNRARIDDNEEERVGALLDAVSRGVDFVDIELGTNALWISKVRNLIEQCHNRTALIVSHHDFRRTPAWKNLIRYFNESVNAGAQVIKIVTLARSPEDNLSVLSLIPYARKRDREIIAFCMGVQGRISRVMAPLLGAHFTFASLQEGTESAAGQLTVREMRRIFRILNPPALREPG